MRHDDVAGAVVVQVMEYLTIGFCRWIVDTSFDYIQVSIVIGSGALKFGDALEFGDALKFGDVLKFGDALELVDALKFGWRCKILEPGAGAGGPRLVSARLVSSRLWGRGGLEYLYR